MIIMHYLKSNKK